MLPLLQFHDSWVLYSVCQLHARSVRIHTLENDTTLIAIYSRLNSRRRLRGNLEEGASYGMSIHTADLRDAFGGSETVLNTSNNVGALITCWPSLNR